MARKGTGNVHRHTPSHGKLSRWNSLYHWDMCGCKLVCACVSVYELVDLFECSLKALPMRTHTHKHWAYLNVSVMRARRTKRQSACRLILLLCRLLRLNHEAFEGAGANSTQHCSSAMLLGGRRGFTRMGFWNMTPISSTTLSPNTSPTTNDRQSCMCQAPSLNETIRFLLLLTTNQIATMFFFFFSLGRGIIRIWIMLK